MFSNQVKTMPHMNNAEESSQFWQTFGLVEKEREEVDGTLVIEIAPGKSAEAIIVLYDLAFIQKRLPEVAGNTPSLMLVSDDITGLYKKMQEAGATVGEMVQLPTDLVFNFADNDDNYFAMMGQESK